MKSHYAEELDDATGPNDTATDVVVSEHKMPRSPWLTEFLVAVTLVGGVLMLATHTDTWFSSTRNDHGIITRWPVPHGGMHDRNVVAADDDTVVPSRHARDDGR